MKNVKIIIMLRNPVDRAFSALSRMWLEGCKEKIYHLKMLWIIEDQKECTIMNLSPNANGYV